MPQAIPSAVLEQAARADAQLAEMRLAAERGESPAPTADSTPVQPSVTQPSVQSPAGDSLPSTDGIVPTGGPMSQVSGDTREGDPKYWENRFRTTEGLNKQLAQENRALRDRLSSQDSRLAALEQSAEEARRQESQRNDTLTALERDREGMEDEYLPVLKQHREMLQAQAEEIARLTSALNDVLNHLRTGSGYQETGADGGQASDVQSQHAVYLGKLFEALGGETNFGVVNRAMENHQWLEITPPGSLQTRKQLLAEANEAMDAARVIALFEAFMKDTGMVARNGNDQPTLTPGSGPGGGQSSSPMISNEEYQAFARDYAKGHYRNRPEEGKKLRAYYDQAWREGRIQA